MEGLAGSQVVERLDGRGERQLANIAAGGLAVGESVGQGGQAGVVAKAGVAHGGGTREDDLAFAVGGEGIAGVRIETEHTISLVTLLVTDGSQRCTEAVFAHSPAIRRVERRSLLGRTQVLVIPETW